MTSPPPPPGWKLQPVIPKSQQQAQETVLEYLKKTLRALPAGAVLDATGYAGPGYNHPCDDNDTSPSAPHDFNTVRELKLPASTDPHKIVTQTGDIWRSWGWYVIERDGFRTPNRFGYAPDGYRLQIVIGAVDGVGPTVSAISPCFPGDLVSDDISIPMVIRAE